MAENLSTRVGRIVSASANALVNALENAAPEVVMEEAIREVEKAIDDVRAELGRILAQKHLASSRLVDENRRHEQLSEQIETALAEGCHDLAEAAVAQQLDIEAQIPVLEQSLSEGGDREKELEGYVAALQGRGREMCDELDRFCRARAEGEATGGTAADTASSGDARTRGEKASRAFDRVLARSAGLPAARDALRDAAPLAELDALTRRNRIRERLAAARARSET